MVARGVALIGGDVGVGGWYRLWRQDLMVAFERISVDYRIMGGVPCIKGTRIPVATVLAMLAEGLSVEAIRADFPQLSDVADALRFAAAVIDEGEVRLRPAG